MMRLFEIGYLIFQPQTSLVAKSSERFEVLDSTPGSIINQLDMFHQGSGYL